MADGEKTDLIYDFLGSAHIFAYAVGGVLEEQLWREAVQDQLTVQQLKLLRLVKMSGSHTVGDIAALLGISNAAASKAVDKMVKLMLLRRSESETDRRAIHLSLTGVAHRALDTYEAVIRSKLSEILAQYSEDELKRMIEMLDLLSAQIVRHHATPDKLCIQCGIYFSDKCVVRQRLDRGCLYARQRDKGGVRSANVEKTKGD